MARELGHKVTTLRPVLIPFVTEESWCRELQDFLCAMSICQYPRGGRRKAEAMGEMMFTHFGITGPIVLSLSDSVSLWLSRGYAVTAELDMKPALDQEKLDRRVLRDLEKYHT